MVITTQNGLDLISTGALNSFDSLSHIAFGDDNTAAVIGDTALGNELLRKTFDITSVKDTGAGTYEVTGRVTLSELNSSTINEIGTFDAASSGNMSIRYVTSSGITKTSSDELIIKLKVAITSTNN